MPPKKTKSILTETDFKKIKTKKGVLKKVPLKKDLLLKIPIVEGLLLTKKESKRVIVKKQLVYTWSLKYFRAWF